MHTLPPNARTDSPFLPSASLPLHVVLSLVCAQPPTPAHVLDVPTTRMEDPRAGRTRGSAVAVVVSHARDSMSSSYAAELPFPPCAAIPHPSVSSVVKAAETSEGWAGSKR
ncbi:hypothetical protein B0H13DRAFT_2322919 [Mycena leptocephala]|nr:hypothetical protein B0H13DRAFT_2322919 [Mycena leptocephala]